MVNGNWFAQTFKPYELVEYFFKKNEKKWFN